MKVEMLIWADEEVVTKLEWMRSAMPSRRESRYPGAQMYLTGSIEVKKGEELNSCPVGDDSPKERLRHRGFEGAVGGGAGES